LTTFSTRDYACRFAAGSPAGRPWFK
jgi:hypothetical protein